MRLILILAAAAVGLSVSDAFAKDGKSSCPVACLTKQSAEERKCDLLKGDDRVDCIQLAGKNYRTCTTACKPNTSAPRPQRASQIIPLPGVLR